MKHLKDIDERVVDIRVPLPNGLERRGSGYLVAPRRVLTALHVIVGKDALTAESQVIAPAQIDVRTLGDVFDLGDAADVDPSRAIKTLEGRAGSDQLWRPAKLIWPKLGTNIPRFDVALIEVSEVQGLRVLEDLGPLMVSPIEDGEEIRALGFPSWSEVKLRDGSTLVEPRTVRARISQTPSIYVSTTEAVITSGAPSDDKKWKGLSGSVLFNKSERLVGVASTVITSASNNVLGVTLLSALGDDEQFADFWPLTALWNPAASASRKLPDFAFPSADSSKDALEATQYVRGLYSLWIESLLRELLDKDAPLPLEGSLDYRRTDPSTDLTAQPFPKISNISEHDPIDDFEHAGRRLLVLGAAGSGKSICALRIVEYLCWRFAIGGFRNEAIPLPLSLSNWDPSILPLRDWLCQEFQSVHKFPAPWCDRWIADGRVIPVLDGLDEAREFDRSAYINGINVFIAQTRLPGLIVCSRWNGEDWISQLDFEYTLTISPTKLSVVNRYLHSKVDLQILYDQIQTRPVLRELVTVPLILRILIRAHRTSQPGQLITPTAEQQSRKDIWGLYVASMLAWENKKRGMISEKGTLRRVRLLAKLMSITDQALIQIERLQPIALISNWSIAIYAVTSRAFCIVLAATMTGTAAGFGLPMGASLGLSNLSVPLFSAQKLYNDIYKSIAVGLITGLLIGSVDAINLLTNKESAPSRFPLLLPVVRVSILLVITIPACMAWLVANRIAPDDSVLLLPVWTCFLFGIRGSRQTRRYDIFSGEFLTWSMPRAGKGLLAGLGIGLGFFVIYPSVAYASIYFAGILLCGAMWGGLTARGPTVAEAREVGAYLWMRNAVFAFALFAVAAAVAMTIVGWFASGLTESADHRFFTWLAIGATKGLMAGIVAFVIYGGLDFIQHLSVRSMLWLSGRLPLRFGHSLQTADRLNFMTRVGSGYRFIHGELQDYFCSMSDESIRRFESAGP